MVMDDEILFESGEVLPGGWVIVTRIAHRTICPRKLMTLEPSAWHIGHVRVGREELEQNPSGELVWPSSIAPGTMIEVKATNRGDEPLAFHSVLEDRDQSPESLIGAKAALSPYHAVDIEPGMLFTSLANSAPHGAVDILILHVGHGRCQYVHGAPAPVEQLLEHGLSKHDPKWICVTTLDEIEELIRHGDWQYVGRPSAASTRTTMPEEDIDAYDAIAEEQRQRDVAQILRAAELIGAIDKAVTMLRSPHAAWPDTARQVAAELEALVKR